MASYYVYFQVGSDGHAGTAGDPFSLADMSNLVNTATESHIFYLRGRTNIGIATLTSQSGTIPHSYLAWDLSAYGPWYIGTASFSTSDANGCTIEGGVFNLSTGDINLTNTTFRNVYINDFMTRAFPNCTIEGSLIYISGNMNITGGTYTDTAISLTGSLEGSGPTFNNCALSVSADNTTSSTYNNTQTDWVAPSLYRYNVNNDPDPAQMIYDTLYADVDTPPQPGNPPYTGYTTDLWGYSRTGIGTGYSAPTVNPPNWTSTFPKVNSVAGTSAQFGVQIDQDGNAYFVVLPNGATAPSSDQVKAGTDSTDTPVASGFSGSVALTADTPSSFSATNLTSETDYDVYLVAENNASDLQVSPVKLDFTTADVTGPSWENSTPSISALHGVTIDFSVQTNETGNVYFVALESGADAPSSAEVKAGTGASGATPIDSGSVAVTASTPAAITSSGLAYGTTYDFYFVAEDSIPNLQSSPTLLIGTTMVNTKDLAGGVGIYRFSITLGSASFTTYNTRLLIPYTGVAETARTADLTTYEYSLDGLVWSAMTPSSGTVVDSLSFTPSGASFSFEWMIKEDLGQSIYNKDIQVRFQATSDEITTSVVSTTYNFGKIVSSAVQRSTIEQLPTDYSGVDGGDLVKEKAPKTN